nr:uncharacterized protein LOC118879776 [Drosophila suzukii]
MDSLAGPGRLYTIPYISYVGPVNNRYVSAKEPGFSAALCQKLKVELRSETSTPTTTKRGKLASPRKLFQRAAGSGEKRISFVCFAFFRFFYFLPVFLLLPKIKLAP